MPDSCDEESIGSQSPPSTPSCVSRLYYTLFYDVTTKELCVTLVKAKGLKGKGLIAMHISYILLSTIIKYCITLYNDVVFCIF